MLSAATAALLAGPAFATATCTTVTTTNPDCVTTSVTSALTTGSPWTSSTITTAVGTAKVGSIYIAVNQHRTIRHGGEGADDTGLTCASLTA